MYGRSGLDRFRKGQSLEPFSVTVHSAPSTRPDSQSVPPESVSHSNDSNFHPHYHHQQKHHVAQKSASSSSPVQSAPATAVTSASQVTQVGGGQSTWQPPDWAIEPRSGVYSLDVLKDGEILDRIKLDRRRHIFGRQFHTCDFVLDHQSVSRQHAAVVPHKNGSIYVIDLGSAHGTFVANERLTKDMPVELEVGQSLRFAASTRIYILRKSCAALFLSTPPHIEVNLPPPPDPSDADAVVAYNTILNRYGLTKPVLSSSSEAVGSSGKKKDMLLLQRPVKKIKKNRVVFKDQLGGELVEVVGTSDGADVDTEPGPLGVKEGSLVGKYESLVQITVIPKGKELSSGREDNGSRMGVTDKLREVLNKVKIPPKSGTGIYDDLYGDSFSVKVGSSWASSSAASATGVSSPSKTVENTTACSGTKPCDDFSGAKDEDDDDLFGD